MLPALKQRFSNLILAAYLVLLTWLGTGGERTAAEHANTFLYVLATLALAGISLLRPPPRRTDSRPIAWLVCLISTLYVLGFSAPGLPRWLIAIHVFGDLTLLQLGRSFSLLPALRTIKTGWAYRLVRHPVYASYLIADAVLVASQPSVRNALVWALGAGALVVRAELEERVLCQDRSYRAYQRRTHYRFFPGVF